MSDLPTAKFLPLILHFPRVKITQFLMRVDVGDRQYFAVNCQKVGGNEGRQPAYNAQSERRSRRNKRRRETSPAPMHYLNFKSLSKCRLNSPVLYPISSCTTENAGSRRARDTNTRASTKCIGVHDALVIMVARCKFCDVYISKKTYFST